MVLYRAEYMVDGTSGLPSKMIENQGASLGRLAIQNRFPTMVRISESTSKIRTKLDGGSGRDGVKGPDERQRAAPLTPSRPPRVAVRVFQLTGGEAVIHGAPTPVVGVGNAKERWATHSKRAPLPYAGALFSRR